MAHSSQKICKGPVAGREPVGDNMTESRSGKHTVRRDGATRKRQTTGACLDEAHLTQPRADAALKGGLSKRLTGPDEQFKKVALVMENGLWETGMEVGA